MRAGARDKGLTENDAGTGPATPVSPALSAHENQEVNEDQPFMAFKFRAATTELTRREFLPADLILVEEADSPDPDFEIMKIFRQKIAGLRRLPKRQRAQARRAALEWLWSNMKALRDKRTYARHRRHMLWQMKRNRRTNLDPN
jgi:hypothetical protein